MSGIAVNESGQPIIQNNGNPRVTGGSAPNDPECCCETDIEWGPVSLSANILFALRMFACRHYGTGSRHGFTNHIDNASQYPWHDVSVFEPSISVNAAMDELDGGPMTFFEFPPGSGCLIPGDHTANSNMPAYLLYDYGSGVFRAVFNANVIFSEYRFTGQSQGSGLYPGSAYRQCYWEHGDACELVTTDANGCTRSQTSEWCSWFDLDTDCTGDPNRSFCVYIRDVMSHAFDDLPAGRTVLHTQIVQLSLTIHTTDHDDPLDDTQWTSSTQLQISGISYTRNRTGWRTVSGYVGSDFWISHNWEYEINTPSQTGQWDPTLGKFVFEDRVLIPSGVKNGQEISASVPCFLDSNPPENVGSDACYRGQSWDPVDEVCEGPEPSEGRTLHAFECEETSISYSSELRLDDVSDPQQSSPLISGVDPCW